MAEPGDTGAASRRRPQRTLAAAALVLVLGLGLVACGGGDGIAVESSGPVSDVTISQTGGQLVVRWEQTADSGACTLDYVLTSGSSGSRSFGAMRAVPLVEHVFDVPGDVVSASLDCS